MSTQAAAAPGSGLGRRWAACADDFAIDAGADEAIIELIGQGRLTATSALVDAPRWRSAAAALAALCPGAGTDRADVGLHLNFTQDLGGGGGPYYRLPTLLVRSALRALPRATLDAAIDRQLDAFEDALGRRPDYVDGHQHVHQLAVVREALVEALGRRYGAQAPFLRSTRPPAGVDEPKARLIAALGDGRLRALARRAGLRVSVGLVGAYAFEPDAAAYRTRMQGWMGAGPDGTVLMCHPARTAPQGDPIGAARVMEYAYLGASAFAQDLQANAITLARPSALLPPRPEAARR